MAKKKKNEGIGYFGRFGKEAINNVKLLAFQRIMYMIDYCN